MRRSRIPGGKSGSSSYPEGPAGTVERGLGGNPAPVPSAFKVCRHVPIARKDSGLGTDGKSGPTRGSTEKGPRTTRPFSFLRKSEISLARDFARAKIPEDGRFSRPFRGDCHGVALFTFCAIRIRDFARAKIPEHGHFAALSRRLSRGRVVHLLCHSNTASRQPPSVHELWCVPGS
jgi:hypothetical protein